MKTDCACHANIPGVNDAWLPLQQECRHSSQTRWLAKRLDIAREVVIIMGTWRVAYRYQIGQLRDSVLCELLGKCAGSAVVSMGAGGVEFVTETDDEPI